MKINLLSKVLFAALLAFVVSSFVYFGFANIYSSKILNYSDFSNQFHSGIYQYRILSGYFLGWIYKFLSDLNIDYQIFKFKFLHKDSEPQMYLSFYILNTFFMVACAVVLVLITASKSFIATNSEKILLIAVALFVMAFTQFVIVPYDVSSYFFLLLFFYLLLKYLEKKSILALIFLIILLLISTLNRESSALSISLAATLLYSKYGLKKETLQPLVLLIIPFVAVYFGMRLMNESFTTNDGNLLLQNFTQPKNLLGLLFWFLFLGFTLIIAKDRNSVRQIVIFHFLALPYIFMCFYTGIIYEIRLYLPLFLTSLLLSKFDLSRIQ